jgi:hypothetical protein
MIMHLILPRKRLTSNLTPLAPLHRAPKSRFRPNSCVFRCVVSPQLNHAAKRLVEAPGCEAFKVVLARVAVAEERTDGYVVCWSRLMVVMY